jgi:hypothetical protein
MIWKPCLDGFYEVSDEGLIRRAKAASATRIGRVLKLMENKKRDGYVRFCASINGKRFTVLVHHLVCDTFIGKPPQGTQRNHKDGNKLNNRADNFEFLTKKEHEVHTSENNLRPIGEKHRGAILKESQVINIKQRLLVGHRQVDIAKDFSVGPHVILHIAHGHSWKHIEPQLLRLK